MPILFIEKYNLDSLINCFTLVNAIKFRLQCSIYISIDTSM